MPTVVMLFNIPVVDSKNTTGGQISSNLLVKSDCESDRINLSTRVLIVNQQLIKMELF